ncbi:tautomerase family protein [Paenibacillus sp. WLX1005]|uniref:tautomerase family protein n=1 Tax=Paenibacillus sp. WLX1005 TaxID=3243766 RepID=UPI0039841668
MPFVEIGYRSGVYETEQLSRISRSVQESLQQHFHVPEQDYFQLLHHYESEQFIYDPHYLNMQRSPQLLYIRITLGAGRSKEQKQRLYQDTAERLEQQVGIRGDDVFIVLIETELDNWSFGKGEAQMLHGANHITSQGEALPPSDQAQPDTIEHHHRPWHPPVETSVRDIYGQIAPQFVRYSEEVLFGHMWRQPELGLRERSLITIAALITAGHTAQLPYHFKLADQHGISHEELVAVITQLAFYSGWPAAAAALQVLNETSMK